MGEVSENNRHTAIGIIHGYVLKLVVISRPHRLLDLTNLGTLSDLFAGYFCVLCQIHLLVILVILSDLFAGYFCVFCRIYLLVISAYFNSCATIFY
jgi:hypothetical protein